MRLSIVLKEQNSAADFFKKTFRAGFWWAAGRETLLIDVPVAKRRRRVRETVPLGGNLLPSKVCGDPPIGVLNSPLCHSILNAVT
jgi:hypothetical protein